jgi:hypothetical protein
MIVLRMLHTSNYMVTTILSTVEICGFRTARLDHRADNDSQHTTSLSVSHGRVEQQAPIIPVAFSCYLWKLNE